MIPNTPIMPLDFWREELSYNPWHFWGLADSTLFPVTSNCNDVIREHAWMNANEAGRSELRQAIMTAENILSQRIGYWAAPVYNEATIPWPKYYDRRQFRLSRTDIKGGWLPVGLEEGHVQVCGVEAFTLIDGAAALVYSDTDGDGLEDTFTITAATTVTDPDEIAIYFDSADRLANDSDLSSRWRIEPIHVTISAGTVTIKGRKWLCVKPIKYESKANYPLDPTVAANFITTCDLYRRYTNLDGLDSNIDSQAALIWESHPCCWGCDTVDNSSDPASQGWVAARAGVRDSFSGIVTPAEAVYDTVLGTWSHPCTCTDACGEPDRVLVRYLAGLPLDIHGWMQKSMRTLVSRLASAEMTTRICACDNANREWSNWQFDVSRVNAPEQYQAGLNVLDNPLGTRRGHIYAWQQIQELARVSGILI